MRRPQSLSQRPWSVALIAGLMLAACSTQTNESQAAVGKVFDWAASPLTEVQFFNEMTTWVSTSHRFPGQAGFQERQAVFEQMARQGYEPAIAAVALFDFAHGKTKHDPKAFSRLLGAANAGNVSAQCALYPVYFLSVGSFDAKNPAAVLGPLLEEGARRGHFACQSYLGFFLWEGREGYAMDRKRAEALTVGSAVAGFVLAESNQALRIGTERIDDLRKAEEALCWAASTYRHSPWEGTDMYANGIRFKAMEVRDRTGNDELLQRVEALIKRWLISRNPAQPKDTDPQECLNFNE